RTGAQVAAGGDVGRGTPPARPLDDGPGAPGGLERAAGGGDGLVLPPERRGGVAAPRAACRRGGVRPRARAVVASGPRGDHGAGWSDGRHARRATPRGGRGV